MSIVKTKNLTYEYLRRDEDGNVEGVTKAVNDVSLRVRRGDFIAIVGHNGSGKSTLAKHLNAILQPTQGTVWVDGIDTREEDRVWEIRQRAGMVFQNPDNQIIGQIVEEDVGFGPENLGVPTREIWQRVEQSLQAVGMYQYRTHSPNKLSGGQKQRVSIAGVLAMHPECIILDEPTAMLDPSGRREVIRAVRELNREDGVTVILITHYMEEVIHADHVYVMDQGRIAMEGTPREIFSQVERLKELRLDVPQVTLLAYELQQRGLKLPGGILTTQELVKALKRYEWPETDSATGAKAVSAEEAKEPAVEEPKELAVEGAKEPAVEEPKESAVEGAKEPAAEVSEESPAEETVDPLTEREETDGADS
ncbi:MAG: energy-coupling factor transporter ATPase [Acetatifactor sp.]